GNASSFDSEERAVELFDRIEAAGSRLLTTRWSQAAPDALVRRHIAPPSGAGGSALTFTSHDESMAAESDEPDGCAGGLQCGNRLAHVAWQSRWCSVSCSWAAVSGPRCTLRRQQ